jgi:hypothetical protein
MSFSSLFSAQAGWWRVTGLVLLSSCQVHPLSSAHPCLSRGPLVASRDTFDLVGMMRREEPPPSEADSLHLPFAHQQRLLHGAYFISRMLDDSTALTTYGGGAFYYGRVRALLRSPRASCHQLVYATADEFSGLFLVIGYPDRPANLYLSGSVGSSYQDKGWHYEADATRGVFLNDTTVLTMTGRTRYAFRRLKQPSYTDTISRRYHIDYRASQFVLLRRDSLRTYLPGEYAPYE